MIKRGIIELILNERTLIREWGNEGDETHTIRKIDRAIIPFCVNRIITVFLQFYETFFFSTAKLHRSRIIV